MNGIGYKFFLWDLILSFYREKDKARADRVKYHVLNWEKNHLKNMLTKRLKAYSDNQITSFMQICDFSNEKDTDIDDLIILLAQGSPRNVIRICKEIFDQQSEINDGVKKISKDSIIRAIEVFAENYSYENWDNNIIKELIKTKRVNFTVNYLSNQVFKFSQQAGIAKVKVWQDKNVVDQLGKIQATKGARKSNLYGIKSYLLAKHIFSDLDIFSFLENKIRECPECGELLLRDWDVEKKHLCHECQNTV